MTMRNIETPITFACILWALAGFGSYYIGTLIGEVIIHIKRKKKVRFVKE